MRSRFLAEKFTIGPDGLPANIETFFTPEMTGISAIPKNIPAAPMRFIANAKGGNAIQWTAKGLQFTEQTAGTGAWTASDTSSQLHMDVTGHIEFDGFVAYDVKMTALSDVSLDDIYMDIPMSRAAARYMMGLNLKGGKRPAVIRLEMGSSHQKPGRRVDRGCECGAQFFPARRALCAAAEYQFLSSKTTAVADLLG